MPSRWHRRRSEREALIDRLRSPWRRAAYRGSISRSSLRLLDLPGDGFDNVRACYNGSIEQAACYRGSVLPAPSPPVCVGRRGPRMYSVAGTSTVTWVPIEGGTSSMKKLAFALLALPLAQSGVSAQ